MADRYLNLRQAMVDAAAFLVRDDVMSPSHHGNVSVKVPAAGPLLSTARGTLTDCRKIMATTAW